MTKNRYNKTKRVLSTSKAQKLFLEDNDTNWLERFLKINICTLFYRWKRCY